MKRTIRDLWGSRKEPGDPLPGEEDVQPGILHEDQQERFDHDRQILNGQGANREEQLHRQVQKEIRTAAELSLKKLHVIQSGLCPQCGEHLRQHLFASICDACGWHTFDVPRAGPVRIHLNQSRDVIEGERCYVLKSGAVLVVGKDVVTAQIPAGEVSWVEYRWDADEIQQRHKQVVDRMTILCGWCGTEAQPESDGFHMVHVAFGASQERYCFCSDKCYEAFRKMYPARVHRNCYERICAECNLCIKRYADEAEGIRMLAKDYLSLHKKR